jgi:hypothetical protein
MWFVRNARYSRTWQQDDAHFHGILFGVVSETFVHNPVSGIFEDHGWYPVASP